MHRATEAYPAKRATGFCVATSEYGLRQRPYVLFASSIGIKASMCTFSVRKEAECTIMLPKMLHSRSSIGVPSRNRTRYRPVWLARDPTRRKAGLRDVPRAKNLSEYRPVQISGTQSAGKSTCASRGGPIRRKRGLRDVPRAKNLSEYRPVQISGTQSAGKSTCANPSVAQVAFPTGYSLPRPRGALSATQSAGKSTCANLSVAQVAFPTGFSLSRLSRRVGHGAGRGSASASARRQPKLALAIDYEAPWGAYVRFCLRIVHCRFFIHEIVHTGNHLNSKRPTARSAGPLGGPVRQPGRRVGLRAGGAQVELRPPRAAIHASGRSTKTKRNAGRQEDTPPAARSQGFPERYFTTTLQVTVLLPAL